MNDHTDDAVPEDDLTQSGDEPIDARLGALLSDLEPAAPDRRRAHLDAALADVRLQVEGPTRDPTSEVERWRLDLPSGRRVVHYGHAVLAGGGFCGFTSSRDGRYLLVTLNAD